MSTTMSNIDFRNKVQKEYTNIFSSKFYSTVKLDDFLKYTQPIHSMQKAIGNTLYGFNHRQTKTLASLDKSHPGFTFFTRPILNLSLTNIKRSRVFMNLSNTDYKSVQRFIRCTLDPRCYTEAVEKAYGKYKGKYRVSPITPSPLVDPYGIFIPVLTNHLESITGWPDPVLPVHTSKEDVRGSQWAIGDGITEIYNAFDLSCTFRNVKDNPIIQMIYYWVKYIGMVFDGVMEPYYDMLAANEIDYNTRIYRLVLDEQNKYVKRIASTGASFPTNLDIGKFFNFNVGNPYGDENTDITVVFKSLGAYYDDPITIDEFNKATCIGCPMMALVRELKIRGIEVSESDSQINMAKIPFNLLQFFNFRGYPFIDYETSELEWWVFKNSPTYKAVTEMIK